MNMQVSSDSPLSWSNVSKAGFRKAFTADSRRGLTELTAKVSLELFNEEWCQKNKIENQPHKHRLISIVFSLIDRPLRRKDILPFIAALKQHQIFPTPYPLSISKKTEMKKQTCSHLTFGTVLNEALTNEKDFLAKSLIQATKVEVEYFFMQAAANGCLKTVKEFYRLYKKKLHLQLINNAAFAALRKDQVRVVSLFVEDLEAPSFCDEDSCLPLFHSACKEIAYKTFNWFLKQEDILDVLNKRGGLKGELPLELLYFALDKHSVSSQMEESNENVIEMCSALLKKGADPTLITSSKLPFLHMILEEWDWKHKDHIFIDLLLENGEDANRIFDSLTPLHRLFLSNKWTTGKNIFTTLISRGAHIWEKAGVGFAPIPYALNKGINIVLLKQILTPYEALCRKLESCQDFLKELQSDPSPLNDVKDSFGMEKLLELLILFQDKGVASHFEAFKKEENFDSTKESLEKKYGSLAFSFWD